MIFISGVHGVGKTFFCDRVREATGIESYSASKLITQKKHSEFAKDKLIPDIDENQQYLIHAKGHNRADRLHDNGRNTDFIYSRNCIFMWTKMSHVDIDVFIFLYIKEECQ